MQSPWGDGNSQSTENASINVLLFEKCSPREGTETQRTQLKIDGIKHLRNAVPVRGLKLQVLPMSHGRFQIWEMQSPWGDGNIVPYTPKTFGWNLRNAVPVRGRKPVMKKRGRNYIQFEKCSPREGTETLLIIFFLLVWAFIWEMQSPWGDGNYLLHY